MNLRWYQAESVKAAWDYLCDKAGNPVIVLPTGAGKSLVIAKLASDAIGFGARVLVLAHRQELLQQNADKLRALLPETPIGLFSSGLKRWNTEAPVVCAGIQSCWRKAEAFGSRQLVLIDEVHLVSTSGEGMYRSFLADVQSLNPKARLVGLTATPFRTGEGSLCGPDKLFQAVCYEAKIPRMIEGGFLSPITSQAAEHSADTSGLHVRSGEFIAGEMEQLFNRDSLVDSAVLEIVAKCSARRSVLVFCAGVDHAEHVAKRLENATRERVGVVTGATPPIERAANLASFRNGSLRWLVNVDVLTTGFDAPNIDAIAVLRATCSPGLFAQICGRGFRLSPGKTDCLVLDFGENVERHGPLDSPDYGKPKGDGRGRGGDAPERKCPNCEAMSPLGAQECSCGFIFPREEPGPRHGDKAAEAALLEAMQPPKRWLVEAVTLRAWENKRTGSRTLRVDYECQLAGQAGNLTKETISEWVCLEHDGYAGRRARAWWLRRCRTMTETIEGAVALWERGAVATPTEIATKKEGKFYRVIDYVLDPIPEVDEYRDLESEPAGDFWGDEASDEIPF